VWHLCFSAAEAFVLPFLNRASLAESVSFHGAGLRDRALAEGRGVLLLVLHLGNVEKLMAAAQLGGMTTNVIAKRFKNRFFDQLVYGTRESFGTTFIDPHSERTAFAILHALKRNEYVAFVIDQAARRPFGVETTFFGRPTTTAYGLALFALKTRAPVVPAWCYRDDTDRLHVCFGDVVPLVDDPDRDRAIQATTQRYNETMEQLIRAHPEHWMWVHNRWKPPR
jgi:KDO2-lipid IV(A) lauroyltransferase